MTDGQTDILITNTPRFTALGGQKRLELGQMHSMVTFGGVRTLCVLSSITVTCIACIGACIAEFGFYRFFACCTLTGKVERGGCSALSFTSTDRYTRRLVLPGHLPGHLPESNARSSVCFISTSLLSSIRTQ